jgi:hypothetical protein
MAINSDWHKKHVMPKNPTVDQRIVWHVEHAKECGCREIPPTLLKEIKKRKIKL